MAKCGELCSLKRREDMTLREVQFGRSQGRVGLIFKELVKVL